MLSVRALVHVHVPSVQFPGVVRRAMWREETRDNGTWSVADAEDARTTREAAGCDRVGTFATTTQPQSPPPLRPWLRTCVPAEGAVEMATRHVDVQDQVRHHIHHSIPISRIFVCSARKRQPRNVLVFSSSTRSTEGFQKRKAASEAPEDLHACISHAPWLSQLNNLKKMSRWSLVESDDGIEEDSASDSHDDGAGKDVDGLAAEREVRPFERSFTQGDTMEARYKRSTRGQ